MDSLLNRARLGRRGAALLFFAGLDLIYAFSLISPDEATRRTPLFRWFISIGPLWLWASLWAVTGLLCLVYAFRRKDTVGFTAAITTKVLWGLACSFGWLIGGVERGYVSAAVWLAAAALVWVIGGWPEFDDERGASWSPPS